MHTSRFYHALLTWLVMEWSRSYHILVTWLIMHRWRKWSCTVHVTDHVLITWLMHRSRGWSCTDHVIDHAKEFTHNAGDLGWIPGLRRFPGGGHGNSLQYSCLEKPCGQRSLAGYSPWGHKESDATERSMYVLLIIYVCFGTSLFEISSIFSTLMCIVCLSEEITKADKMLVITLYIS